MSFRKNLSLCSLCSSKAYKLRVKHEPRPFLLPSAKMKRGRAVPPTDTEWEKYRKTITDLYTNQGLSLMRLRERMHDEYGFQATDNMYKKRFTQWKLWKNVTADRIWASSGSPAVQIQAGHGHSQRAETRLKNYYRRLPNSQKKRDLMERLELSNSHEILSVRENASALCIHLSPPADVKVPDYYHHLLRQFVRGSTEANLWPRDELNGFRIDNTVPAWCSSVMSAYDVLRVGKIAEANRFLHHFIRQCSEQLSRQDPLLFMFLYTSMLFFSQKNPEITQRLLNAVLLVSENLPWASSLHPLRLLIQEMRRFGPSGITRHADGIILSYIGMIHETLGGAYPIVQDMLSDLMDRLSAYRLRSAGAIVDIGCKMKQAADLQNKNNSRYYLNLKMALAEGYFNMGRFNEAYSEAAGIMSNEYASIRNDEILPSLHMLLSKISEAMGDQGRAEESAVRAVLVSMKTFGKSSDWTLKTFNFHEELLRKFGKYEEAKKASRYRNLVIEELCPVIEELEIIAEKISAG